MLLLVDSQMCEEGTDSCCGKIDKRSTLCKEALGYRLMLPYGLT